MFKYPLPENIELEVKFLHSLILKRSDGIIEVRCEDDFTYDVQDIKQNHDCLKNMMVNDKLLVLNFTERFTSITNNARSYLAEGFHKEFIAAEAFLIHSLPQRMLANFYFKINKPIVPAGYFSYQDKESAEKWLLTYRKQ